MFDLYTSPLTYGLISFKPFPRLCEFPLYVSQGEIHVNLLVNFQQVKLSLKELIVIKKFHFLIFNDILKLLKTFLVEDIDCENNKVFCVAVNRSNNYNIDFETMKNHEELITITELSNAQRSNLRVNNNTFLHKIVTPWYRNVDVVITRKIHLREHF